MSKAPKTTSRGAGVIDRHVGGRLRERRLALGMSQTDLADELELTFQQVQKYEKGTNRIGAGRLLIAANVLKTSVAFFYQGAPGMKDGGDNDGGAPDVANAIARVRDGHALASAFIAIKDRKARELLVGLAENMVAREQRAP
jgi:transcriptional regulator with XRE-family HTH domain